MKVKSESEVTQSCLIFRDPVDCSPPGSSAHGIFQAGVLEWGAIAFSILPSAATNGEGQAQGLSGGGAGRGGMRVDGLAHALLGCPCREHDGLGNTFP